MATTHLPPSGLLGRQSECEALDRLVAGVRAGQSRVLVLRGEAGVGKTALLEYLAASASGCRIARAAGVESEMELPFAGLHALCAPMLGRLRRLPGPQRDALSTAFGLDRGAAAGSVHGRAGGAEPARRRRRGAAADVHRRRRAVARSRVGADAGVRRAPAAGRAGRAGVRACARTATITSSAGLPELAVEGIGARDARVLLDATVPGPLDERVRDRILAEASRQSARAAGAAARADADGGGRRLRVARLDAVDQPHRAGLRAAAGTAAGRDPAAAAARGGRARRRRDAAAARGGAARARGRRGRAGRGRGPDRHRCAGAVPASAGALGGVPGGERAGPPRRPSRAGRGDRSAARSRSARVASRARRGALRRDRGRRAGALGRPRAQPRRHRRGGRVPRARGGADPRSGPARPAGAGRRAGQVRVGGAGGRAGARGGRGDVPAGRAPERPARPPARTVRVRLDARHRRSAPPASTPPDGSKRSIPRWRARRISRRSER